MQSLNILIVGEGKYAEELKTSKYLNKLYITGENELPDTIHIKFNTFRELAKKCKALKIDIVFVENEKWVLEGITDVMKQNFINCFSVTSEWTKLGLSHNYARNILSRYGINIPPQITLPVEFPVLVKGDGILRKANSMQEIISIKKEIHDRAPEISKNVFLEKYLLGEKQKIISLYDGKHLITFPNSKINPKLLSEYSKKLEFLLQSEHANFTGFINSDLIEEKGILYNTGFFFNFYMPDMKKVAEKKEMDFLYICISAIYQKLNEIDF